MTTGILGHEHCPSPDVMKTRLRISIGFSIVALGLPSACGKSEPDDGGPADWAACELNSDCVLSAASCCGVCGEPALADMEAVNRQRLDAHFSDVCPEPLPCPQCATSPNPFLQATCGNGTCLALDMRMHPAAACTIDDECRLRVTGCCECGGSTASWDLIAINRENEALYAGLVCDPGQACAECAPIYPTDVEAFCAADGHCATRPASDCDVTCAEQGLTCCSGMCVLTSNDIFNCGGCGNVCPDSAPYCDGHGCTATPCNDCAPGELCCTVPGPGPAGSPACYAPNEAGTCPVGCPLCL